MDYNINVISYCFVRHNGVFLIKYIKYIVFMMVLYSKKHKKLENFYKFFVFVLTKEMFLFIMYIKTLKRRVESCLINTETFQLVREMRKKLLNMALESSH